MTAGGDGAPAGGGGHAWERLREQRAKDLGEDPGPDPGKAPGETADTDSDDDTEREGQTGSGAQAGQ
jgi:hypothetical protein